MERFPCRIGRRADLSELSATDETYNIWRRKNPTKRPYLDVNKLASPVVPSLDHGLDPALQECTADWTARIQTIIIYCSQAPF